MKRISILMIGLFSLISLKAQEQGLVIVYNQQTKIDINPNKSKRYIQMMEAAVKRIDQNELITTAEKAIFRPIEKIDNEQHGEGTRAWVILNSTTPTFIDLQKQKIYQIKNNMEKEYEIMDSLKQYDWQLIRESKKVLGFDCKKAVAKNEKEEITAWYAPKLPYRVGPNSYTGVPGTILELEIKFNNKENSRLRYWATDVQVKDDIIIDFPEIKNPITLEEYEAENKRLWEEMRAMQNQGVDKD